MSFVRVASSPFSKLPTPVLQKCSKCTYPNDLSSSSCASCGASLRQSRKSKRRSGRSSRQSRRMPLSPQHQLAVTFQSPANLFSPNLTVPSSTSSTAITDAEGSGDDDDDDDASFNDNDIIHVWNTERNETFDEADDSSTNGAHRKRDLSEEETQRMEQEKLLERKKVESDAMMHSVPGRAWKLVEEVVQLHKDLMKYDGMANLSLEPLATDDIVYLAEQFINTHIYFGQIGRPKEVTIGYHFTLRENLDGIRQGGLMSCPERRARGVGKQGGGAVFGEGIYTGRNPEAFSTYGHVGLLVAIVKGKEKYVQQMGNGAGYNTVIGNKKMPYPGGLRTFSTHDPFYDEVVLKQSGQCLPLFTFSKTGSWTYNFGEDRDFNNIWICHRELQKLLDAFFNNGKPVEVKPMRKKSQQQATNSGLSQFRFNQNSGQQLFSNKPSPFGTPASSTQTFSFGQPTNFSLFGQRQPPQGPLFGSSSIQPQGPSFGMSFSNPPSRSFTVNQPTRLGRSAQAVAAALAASKVGCTYKSKPSSDVCTKPLRYNAPQLLGFMRSASDICVVSRSTIRGSDCAICMNDLSEGSSAPVKLSCGDHFFHRDCIERALQSQPKCPICRRAVGKPQGTGPSGEMRLEVISRTCDGFEFSSNGTIVITYVLEGGFQTSYHPNPGVSFAGTTRVAYLPNNEEGRQLLKRIKFAFMHGLLFAVGISLTTGQPNRIVWSSIHQKTKMSGGTMNHGFPDVGFFINCNEELNAAGVPAAKDLPN